MAQGEERPSGGGDDENGKYPIGFRFEPTTEELVEFYLIPKLLGEPTVPNEFVIDADAYKFDPEILTEEYKERGVDDTWYFLSPRNRKYPGGDRPVRRTADERGRWKPSTGQSKPPEEEEEDASTSTSRSKAKKKFAFTENTLAYYVGPTKDEAKTKWLMHELVVPETPDNGFHAQRPRDDKLLNRFVACRIYKSPLKKWKDKEAAAAAEAPTSSQSSGPAPDGEEEAARAASGRQPPAKRPAVERSAGSGHTGAPNKGVSVSQTTSFPGGGRSAPMRGSGGGSSVHVPPAVGVGAGAGAAGHQAPQLPPLVHWPPVYNSMQGPVQMQQPPLIYRHSNGAAGTPNANGQAASGQGMVPVSSRPRPPHRAAAATAPNSQGPTMMVRPPPNLAAGQSARLPSPRQQQQQRQQPPPQPETEEAYRNRVYAMLIAEMKLQKAREEASAAARAGQQQQQSSSQTASAKKAACFHCVRPAEFTAPRDGHPCSSGSNLAQRQQRQQQSSSATPPAAENVPCKQSVPPGANDGSGKVDASTTADNIILQILGQIRPL